jgi:dTDP-4-dehydrorhamnose 3,5-epimerase
VLRGRIMDVAVDARPGSPTRGTFASAELSATDEMQILIPAGFLHGFCTLEDDTVVLYKMSGYYAPGKEVGAMWNDPDLNIPWPTDATQAILSDKDKALPRFKDIAPW